MDTYEASINDKSEKILIAFIRLSMGKKVGFFSRPIYKRLKKHKNFERIKKLIIDYLTNFNGDFTSPQKLMELSKFKLELHNLYKDN